MEKGLHVVLSASENPKFLAIHSLVELENWLKCDSVGLLAAV